MSRKGKMFKAQSLMLPIQEVEKASGIDKNRLLKMIEVFLFLYRQFKNKKRARNPEIRNVKLHWQQFNGQTTGVIILPKASCAESFKKFCVAIKKYRKCNACFFVWRRAYNDKTRKISYQKVWEFNRYRERYLSGESIFIPLEADYIDSITIDGQNLTEENMHFSLSMWVPHKVDLQTEQLMVDYAFYPAEENWQEQNLVYVEWTKAKIQELGDGEWVFQDPPSKETDRLRRKQKEQAQAITIGQILNQCDAQEVESLRKDIRGLLQNKYPELYDKLEILSVHADESLSFDSEAKLRALIIALMEE